MTYCLGIAVEAGLVLASDSRTNAGIDYVTSFSKLHVLTPAPDRLFVLLSAGNLATTQEVMNRIRRDLDQPPPGSHLGNACYLFEAAAYVGRQPRRAARSRPGPGRERRQRADHAAVGRPDRRPAAGPVHDLPAGQLLCGLAGDAVPADRREQVRQAGARSHRAAGHVAGGRGAAVPGVARCHVALQRHGRPAVRAGDLPARCAWRCRTGSSCRRTRRCSPRFRAAGTRACAPPSRGCRGSTGSCRAVPWAASATVRQSRHHLGSLSLSLSLSLSWS
jgi:hypothetical protein